MDNNQFALTNFKGLHDLKTQAREDQQKALPDAAKQFEAIFLQSMLKSMRTGQHFLNEDSLFSNKNQEMFQDMLDSQYASNMANEKGIGLASLLTQQIQKANTSSDLHQQELVMPPLPTHTATHTPVAKQITPNTEVMAKSDKSKTESAGIDDFVKSILPYAQKAASVLGLDPKILMAQAALETGWGKFVAQDNSGTSNNLFNIKSNSKKAGAKVEIQTTEYIANIPFKMKAAFKKYESVEHSFNDYIDLVKNNSRYEEAVANAHNPQRYIKALHEAGYATDPNYASKILSIYNSTELNEAIVRNQ